MAKKAFILSSSVPVWLAIQHELQSTTPVINKPENSKITMQIRVLGCSGGIGQGLRTTALLLDQDVLIDCGSGAGDLTLDELRKIRHIFLTHGHLDHIAFIPFLVDSVFDALVNNPLTIHLLAETLEMLQQHIFNRKIWPDFARLPDEANPVIRYEVIVPGQQITLEGRSFEPIPVTHTQPAVGYRVQAGGRSFAFSGDTRSTDRFWEVLNGYPDLDILVVECAYADHETLLSEVAGHHRPSTLATDLGKLTHHPTLYITHQKPGEEAQIMQELSELISGRQPRMLERGQILQF
jgi:ribonuclease BN (tRNA processing enzyme)